MGTAKIMPEKEKWSLDILQVEGGTSLGWRSRARHHLPQRHSLWEL